MDRSILLKVIWGISKELGINKDELYILLDRETGKDSMRKCSDDELKKLIKLLDFFKAKEEIQKTGNRLTAKQLKFIRDLEKQLDWDKEPERLLGFIKKQCEVDAVEWLSTKQASNVIEALKNMLKNKNQKEKSEAI